MEMAGLVRTPTEWYAIGTAFHQDAICRRSLDEGEPSGNECSDNGSKAEERKVIEKRSQLHWNATFSFGFIFFEGVGILGSFLIKGRTSERKKRINKDSV